jgi:putative PIN family toxin of toxin-antitoxin system
VLVSGILFGGTPGQVIDLWKDSKLDVYYTPEILGEYGRVLSYPKFKLPLDVTTDILSFVTEFGKRTEQKTEINVVEEDPSDNVFLACAIDSGCQVIITGDKHLLTLKEYKGIEILTPEKFLSAFVNSH